MTHDPDGYKLGNADMLRRAHADSIRRQRVERLLVESHEVSILMTESPAEMPLELEQQGDRTWLRRGEDGKVISAWALPLLCTMRGVDVEGLA